LKKLAEDQVAVQWPIVKQSGLAACKYSWPAIRLPAPGNILNDDVRISRVLFSTMLGKKARIGIKSTTRSQSHNDANVLSFVE
jgi:hypothetical protein